MSGHIVLLLVTLEGIDQSNALGDAQVEAMHAALGTVHAAAQGAVAVVEQFTGEAGQDCAGWGSEGKRRDGSAVLSEIDHQLLARLQRNGLTWGEVAHTVHLAVCLVGLSAHAAPGIALHGLQCQVVAQVDLGTLAGEDAAAELVVLLGSSEQFGCLVAWFHACVVAFAIIDACQLHGSCDASLPMLKVGAKALCGAVAVGQFEHGTKCRLLAQHSFGATGGDDLVGPPAWGDFGSKDILGSCICAEGVGHIVGERAACLGKVGIARLEVLVADGLSVDKEHIGAQTCGHPAGTCHALLVRKVRDEPTGTFGGGAVFLFGGNFGNYGRIGSRNPDALLPIGGRKCFGTRAGCALLSAVCTTGHCGCHHGSEDGWGGEFHIF